MVFASPGGLWKNYCGKRERGDHLAPHKNSRARVARSVLGLTPFVSRSGGQDLATLGATAGQNLTAVGSSHSLTETVDLGAVTAAGLIGTLHMQNTSCLSLIIYARQPAVRPQQNIISDHT